MVPTTVPTGDPGKPRNPSFIGVDCAGKAPVLRVNFESNIKPDIVGQFFEPGYEPAGEQGSSSGPGVDYQQGSFTEAGCSLAFGLCLPATGPDGTGDPKVEGAINNFNSNSGGGGQDPVPYTSSGAEVQILTDVSNLLSNRTGNIYANLIPITSDHWHHVLVSVNFNSIFTDVSFPAGPTVAQIYIALDDKNYTKNELSDDWTGGGPNDIVPDDAFASGDGATYSLAGGGVPAGPLGLPGVSGDRIYHVEMAEFQMWTGLVRDTADVTLRRLFVDDKGKPVPPKKAEAVLGTPTFRFHPAADWIAGRDTGLNKQTFTTIQPIKRYKPDPSLHGNQGTPQ
jgi:hypothetical protein